MSTYASILTGVLVFISLKQPVILEVKKRNQ